MNLIFYVCERQMYARKAEIEKAAAAAWQWSGRKKRNRMLNFFSRMMPHKDKAEKSEKNF